MRGLDIKTWGMWELIEASGFFIGAIGLIVHKDLPEVPQLLGGSVWVYAPLLLMAGSVALYLGRLSLKRRGRNIVETDAPHNLLEHIALEPASDFKFLPIKYAVDLVAEIPNVECCFWAVNFHPKPLTVSHFRLGLRLPGGPTLENIPLRADELTLNPKCTLNVVCYRNLSDAESKAIAAKKQRGGSAVWEMFVKATEAGGATYKYGPVASMVIDGWINAPQPKPG